MEYQRPRMRPIFLMVVDSRFPISWQSASVFYCWHGASSKPPKKLFVSVLLSSSLFVLLLMKWVLLLLKRGFPAAEKVCSSNRVRNKQISRSDKDPKEDGDKVFSAFTFLLLQAVAKKHNGTVKTRNMQSKRDLFSFSASVRQLH